MILIATSESAAVWISLRLQSSRQVHVKNVVVLTLIMFVVSLLRLLTKPIVPMYMRTMNIVIVTEEMSLREMTWLGKGT